MTDRGRQNDHDRTEQLLPWYVNNTLDSGEREAVERHVERCPDCQAAVAELSLLQSAVWRDPATPIVPEPDVPGFLESLDSAGKSLRLPTGWALAASIAVISVALLVYLALQGEPPELPARFETATSANGLAMMDYVLDLRFDDTVDAAARDDILRDIGPAQITRSGSDGVYRVVVKIPASSLEELDRYTSAIAAVDGVDSVDVVALQLPVSRDP